MLTVALLRTFGDARRGRAARWKGARLSRRRDAKILHQSNLAPANRAFGGIVGGLCGGSLLLGSGETRSPYSSNPQISRKTCRTIVEKVQATALGATSHSRNC